MRDPSRTVRILIYAATRGACYTLVWLAIWVAAPTLGLGWSPYVVGGTSMSPALRQGDIVLAGSHRDDVTPGTIVVFRDRAADGRVTTHRVTDVNPDGTYVTRGDAVGRDDPGVVSPKDTLGVARLVVPAIGTPVLWADSGRWLLLLGAVATVAALYAASVRLERGLVGRPAPGSSRRSLREILHHPGLEPSSRRLAGVTLAGAVLVLDVAVASVVARSPIGAAAFRGVSTSPGNSFVATSYFRPTYVRTLGSATCDTSGETTVSVPADGVPAGHTLFVRVVLGDGAQGAVAVSDTAGNIYDLDAEVTASSGGGQGQGGGNQTAVRTTLFSAAVADPLPGGSSLTIGTPSSASVSVVVDEFGGVAGSGRVLDAAATAGKSTAPSATVTAAEEDILFFGLLGTQVVTTVTDPWTTTSHVDINCGNNGSQQGGNHAGFLVADSGATYDLTLDKNSDWAEVLVAYRYGR